MNTIVIDIMCLIIIILLLIGAFILNGNALTETKTIIIIIILLTTTAIGIIGLESAKKTLNNYQKYGTKIDTVTISIKNGVSDTTYTYKLNKPSIK